jgi:preprotein translocase subunit SecG
MPSLPKKETMLDKILFWVVLVWMIGMLVMAFLAVREVWREASKPESDADNAASPSEGKSSSADPKDAAP